MRKHQIIVEAQAHGTGSEQELLLPVVTAMRRRRHAGLAHHRGRRLSQRSEPEAARRAMRVDALIADNQMRRRDERFATQDRHKDTPPVLHDKSKTAATTATVYRPHDFTYDATARTCVCPAGKSLYRKGGAIVTNGYVWARFRGHSATAFPVRIARSAFARPRRPRCAT